MRPDRSFEPWPLCGALDSGARPFTTWLRSILVLIAAFASAFAIADDSSSVQSLRAKFPDGIPWRVEVLSADGKSLGILEMLITSDQASSCLGEMSGGVRVTLTRKENLSPTVSVASYGVAKFTGDKIKIDLTGGICDAYLLMSGAIASDGSSTGAIYTLNMGGGHDVGTYHATIK